MPRRDRVLLGRGDEAQGRQDGEGLLPETDDPKTPVPKAKAPAAK